jgi:membrane protein DedA with SNARE-associated domain
VIALSLVERLVEWVEPVFSAAGYYIIAVAVLAERSILIGLVVPGDFILALGGVYAAQGRVSLVWVIVIGILGATCGESIGYWLGRSYGMNLIRHIPFVNRLEPALHGAQDYFTNHGGKTVAIGRYATAAGAFIPFTAGMARMPYRRFLAFDIPAIVVWAVGISIFGYVFGENLAFIDRVLSRFGYIVLGVIAVGVIGWVAWKRTHPEKAESQKNEEGSDQDVSPK